MFFAPPRASLVILIIYAAVPPTYSLTVRTSTSNLNATHDLSALYDVTPPGAGDYSIKPSTRVTHIDANGTLRDLYADVEDKTNIRLSGDLAVSKPDPEPRLHFKGCSPEQQKQITAAAQASYTYATKASKYILEPTGPWPIFETWFGDYDKTRHAAVMLAFAKISRNNLLGYTYDCRGEFYGAICMVDPKVFGVVHLFPAFWKLSTHIQAREIISSASNFQTNGNARYFQIGQSGSQELAQLYPDTAVHNADNYAGFAMDVASKT